MTTKKQHTIQPINKGEHGYLILDKNDNFFAKTYSSTNANLIAAAPDMLEELEKALLALNAVPSSRIPSEPRMSSYDIAALIESVLAKARGQQNT